MIQIIGAGGFGRELAAYLNKEGINFYKWNHHTDPAIQNIGTVIAVGNEETRYAIVTDLDNNVKYISVNLGRNFGEVSIWPGTIICPGTILTTNVTIGFHCLVNINCTIGHDARIGNFVTVNPGVNISGNVTIGNNCNIGSNSVIREGITICDDVTIGAGAVVVKDITEPGVYVGSPATRLDKRPKFVTQLELSEWQKNILKTKEIKLKQ